MRKILKGIDRKKESYSRCKWNRQIKRKRCKSKKGFNNLHVDKCRGLRNLSRIKQTLLKSKYKKDCMNRLLKNGKKHKINNHKEKKSSYNKERSRRALTFHNWSSMKENTNKLCAKIEIRCPKRDYKQAGLITNYLKAEYINQSSTHWLFKINRKEKIKIMKEDRLLYNWLKRRKNLQKLLKEIMRPNQRSNHNKVSNNKRRNLKLKELCLTLNNSEEKDFLIWRKLKVEVIKVRYKSKNKGVYSYRMKLLLKLKLNIMII